MTQVLTYAPVLDNTRSGAGIVNDVLIQTAGRVPKFSVKGYD